MLFPHSEDDQRWSVTDFQQWRLVCRFLLAGDHAPSEVMWCDQAEPEGLLTYRTVADLPANVSFRQSIPRPVLDWLRMIAHHRSPQRWEKMYRAIWRYFHGESNVLQLATDDLVADLNRLHRQVKRDCHKTKAFVRFKKVSDEGQHYVAWHRSDHDVLPLVADFFSRRFTDMSWTIMTPWRSVSWDTKELTFGQGVSSDQAPQDEELERLWGEYYRRTFNPARIKVATMKREMPVRFWDTLPETQWIQQMLAEAPSRVDKMIQDGQAANRSAEQYLPEQLTLEQLKKRLPDCQGCDLCDNGTRPVSGSGPHRVKVMLVGEQPGDQEELAGEPFVGPAGQLLREVLEEIGQSADDVFLTNSVKHFRHVNRGGKCLHQKPTARQVIACQPWLAAEIAILKPKLVVGLGSTAMNSLLGHSRKLADLRGQWVSSWASPQTLITWHPAAILRSADRLGHQRRLELRRDLQLVFQMAKEIDND